MMSFRVLARLDAQALARAINYFAQLGLVPSRVLSEVKGDRMVILIEQPGLDRPRAAVIAEKMRNSVLLEAVELLDDHTAGEPFQ